MQREHFVVGLRVENGGAGSNQLQPHQQSQPKSYNEKAHDGIEIKQGYALVIRCYQPRHEATLHIKEVDIGS